MKLVFPNGEHDTFEVPEGSTVVIGRGEGSDLRLDVDGVAEHHAKIDHTSKGVYISVENAANITRINGALVVARTPLAGGEALLFNKVQCQVAGVLPQAVGVPASKRPKPEDDDGDDGATKVRMAIPQFVLRGVSGSTFGKHFPIYGSAVIGRHSDCDICLPGEEVSRRHAKLVVNSDGLTVEDLGSSNGTYINGKRVKREKAEPGDELKLDTVRFLVQSPGQEAPRKSVEEPAAPATEQSDDRPMSGAVKAVVAITAIIALVVAGLYFGNVI